MAIEQEVLYFEPNNVEFRNEDLSVGIYLDVEILDRSLADYGVSNDKSYTGSITIGASNVNFLEGENNVLTTSYSDVTILELSNGGNKESIGIESINIKYTSWYFPEINIKFVDVRGNAVFNPMEKKQDKEDKGSFFHCLFDFPYPIFKLTVKGYFGKPVTYRLTVKDMRSTFNSNTGNFEINVNFIGYMYSYLTDIPMSLLFLAPYIEYNGISSSLGDFSSGKNANAPIPNFVEFIQNITEAIKLKDDNPILQQKKQESEFYKHFKDNIDSIDRLYGTLRDITEKYFEKKTDTDSSFKFSNEKFRSDNNKQYDNQYFLAKAIVDNINNIKVLWDGIKNRGSSIPDLVIYENTVSKTFPNFGEGDSTYIMLNKDIIKDDINIYVNYDKDKETWEKYKREIDNHLTLISEQSKKLKEKIFQDISNWKPTIRNVFEIVLAHMDKFQENMTCCIDNIKKSTNRKLSDIPKYETDCNSNSKDITVFPFPAFYDEEKKYTWIGDVPNARDYDERNFINAIIEASSTAGSKLHEAFTDYENSLQATNTFPQNGIPVLFYDLKYGNEYKNTGKKFQVLTHYPDNDKSKLPPALEILAYRYILWKLFNSEVNIKPSTFGKIEALNFLDVHHNVKDFPKDSFWQNDYADGGKHINQFTDFIVKKCGNFSMNTISKKKDSNNKANVPVTYKILSTLSPIYKEDDVFVKAHIGTNDSGVVKILDEIYHNGSSVLDYSFDNIMSNVSVLLLENGIDDKNYSTVFPSNLSSIQYYDLGKTPRKGNILNLYSKFDEYTKDLEKETDKVSKFTEIINTNENINKEISEAIKGKEVYCYTLGIKTKEGVEYSFEDLGWVTEMTDFYPCFKVTEERELNSFGTAIKKKEGWIRELLNINKNAECYCSFSCRKYWDKNEEIETDEVLSKVLNDFFISTGILSSIFDVKSLKKLENSGLIKIPMLMALYLGREITKIKPQSNNNENGEYQIDYEEYKNLNISKFLVDFYNNNWRNVAKKIEQAFLNDRTVDGVYKYDDLVYTTTDNNTKQYFFRVLHSESKQVLSQLLTQDIYINGMIGITSIEKDKSTNDRLSFNKVNPEFKGDDSEVREVLTSFIETVRNNSGLNVVDNAVKEDEGVPKERKLAVYDTVKNLYDRWKFGTYSKTSSKKDFSVGIDNFVFRNVLNKDVGDELTLNLEKIANLINSIYKGGNDMSVYSFLYEVCSYADCLMLALPVNIFDAINSTEKLSQMFTPHNYITAREDAEETTFVVTQRQKDSQHLSFSPNVSSYKDDGIDFIKYIHKSDSKNGDNMGVFGVTYSFGEQHLFKDIQVSMDKPKVTEQSIASTLSIAEQGGKNGSNKLARVSHDLFDTYSNHSYHCTVNMMGNAQIMPMMYFQLNNIPMFKGGYIIASVEHTLNNQGMTTTFTGNRLNKHSFDLNLSQSYDSGLMDDSDIGEYDYYEINGGKLSKHQNSNTSGKDVEKLNYSKNKTIILIDAGHYMSRSGKESPDLNPETDMFDMNYEERFGEGILNPNDTSGKEVYQYREYWGNRKIAMDLCKKLTSNGYNAQCVFNTNKSAKDYSSFTSKVDDVYEEQKRNGGSTIIIAIHSNAAADSGWGRANRWEIYKQNPDGEKVTSINRQVYPLHPETSHLLAKCIASSAKKTFDNLSNDKIIPNVNGKRIIVYTEPQTFTSSRNGYRPTTFPKAPSVLSENLFHDTKSHVKFLGSKEGRDAIVNLHYDGIVKFFEEINKK